MFSSVLRHFIVKVSQESPHMTPISVNYPPSHRHASGIKKTLFLKSSLMHFASFFISSLQRRPHGCVVYQLASKCVFNVHVLEIRQLSLAKFPKTFKSMKPNHNRRRRLVTKTWKKTKRFDCCCFFFLNLPRTIRLPPEEHDQSGGQSKKPNLESRKDRERRKKPFYPSGHISGGEDLARRSHSLRHRRKFHRYVTPPRPRGESVEPVVCKNVCSQVLRGPCSSRPCATGRNRPASPSSRRRTRRATSCSPTDPAGEPLHSPRRVGVRSPLTLSR